MLDIIQSWRAKNALRKQLLAFLNEMDKNLETLYVIEQRQFILSGFLLDKWEHVKDLDLIKHQEAVKVYAAALLDFNNALKEHKTYEQWYASDIKHKTKDNAQKLHVLKNALDQKVNPLESIIITAGQAFERELLNMGLISN